jgi:hypothetical protein
MTAKRVRTGAGLGAIALFLLTAGRSIGRMGPTPDGTCAMAPTCPNSHQWVALLVVAGLCVVLAFLTWAAVVSRPRWSSGVLICLALAIAVAAVNPPDHLNSPRADWFGHSLGDGTLN